MTDNPKLKMKDFQIEGVKFILRHLYAIIGDQMGLGKTVQAIALSLITDSRTLIMCPASLRYNWENEFAKWSLVCPTIHVVGTEDLDADFSMFKVIIVSYDLVARYPELLDERELVVLDEIQAIKNEKTNRFEGVEEYVKRIKPKYLVGLSGTPITKSVTDWYALLCLLSLCPEDTNGYNVKYLFPHFYNFATHFSFERKQTLTNKKTKKKFKVTSFSGVQRYEELQRLKKGKYIRRLAKDHLDLPTFTRKDVIIDRDIDADLKRAWENGDIDNESVMTAKAHSAFLKGPSTGNYVKDLIRDGEGPVVIFTDHINPIVEIKKRLKKYKGEVIQGLIKSEKRQEIVDRFQAGELDYLIATYETAAEGYTMTRARNMVLNDLPWKPKLIEQAEYRLIRISQERKVVIHRIIKGIVDERIVVKLTSKIRDIDKVT